ncbi:hypothetical protein B484DRAFT_99900 [Ochromonadaceae sp. CCMP2298]|nr:hypothetical protein B484DRAFT_178539 [Ochromonadaceae sp. CCMP2298]KAJ1424225.1 hypothetical protein B484DRAFT_99900 [Ochromonadaceae sp. CCMP2298]
MYRKHSFSAKAGGLSPSAPARSPRPSSGSNTGTGSTSGYSNQLARSGEGGVGEEEGANVVLKSEGKFMSGRTPSAGLVACLRNPAARNRACLSVVAFGAGKFALADERGQVFRMNMQSNHYHSVRLASTAVTALCFIQQHKHHLVVCYDSGAIVVVDTHSKDITGNLKGKSVARIVRSNPDSLKIAIASEDKTLSVWDLENPS